MKPSPKRQSVGDAGVATRLVSLSGGRIWVRVPNPKRQAAETYKEYKKGSEVRLFLESAAKLQEARRLLSRLELKPGRAFRKGKGYVQPVYGSRAVRVFQGAKG